jgi:predicted small lipoprotein YifL
MRAEAGMTRERTVGIVAVAAAIVGLAACGLRGPRAPGREAVTPLLQKEANDLKASGEKLDPVLGVKATWTIAGIDVTERPDDADRPWAGVIRFRIRSETKDMDGAVVVDEFDKRFDYVYSAALQKWIFQLPPSPAPKP